MEVTVMKTLAKKENPLELRGPSLVAKSSAFCFAAFSPSGAVNARFDTLRNWSFQHRWHRLLPRIFIRAILAQCDMQWTCKIAVIAQCVGGRKREIYFAFEATVWLNDYSCYH